jgi:hypothetical protein
MGQEFGLLKMVRIGCPELSVRNYYYSLRNNPKNAVLIYFAMVT